MRELLKKVLPEPIKRVIKRVRREIRKLDDNLSYIYHTRRLARNADTSRPVEVAVFIIVAENWNSFESVYRNIVSDDRINITVYVFPGYVFTDTPEKLNLKFYGEVLEFFAARGIEVVKAYDPETNTWMTPETVKADYVFYDEPYGLYPEEFSFRQTYKRARICYIPYTYSVTRTPNMLRITMPETNFRFIYALFASGDYVADYAEKLYGRILLKYHRVMRLGFPRFDLTYKITGSTYGSGGYTVIWNPRFTLSEDNNGDPSSRTTFFDFRSKIIDRASSHTDEYWIIRPHPRAFSQYLSKGLLSREELNQYISSLENNPRTELDKNKDYLDAFMRSDVMLADLSSIIIEYLALGKPVIYCGNIEAISDNKVLECMYIAASWDEAMALLEKLKNGIDPLAEKRRAFADTLSSKGRSGKLITEFLINDYNHKGRKS